MGLTPVDGSLAREFLLWFMRYPPFNPYVSTNVAVDFTVAKAYLDRLNAEDRSQGASHVTIQHLVSAAVARVYTDIPAANALIIGNRIYRHDHVGIAMPVNLLDHEAGRDIETTIAVIEEAETRSLRELAALTTRRVRSEQSGEAPLLSRLVPLARHIPRPLRTLALDLVDAALHIGAIGRFAHRFVPVTVGISNVGAAFRIPAGGVFRGAAFAPPDRLLAVGSVFGLSSLQDEVVPVDGRPAVRPMLPVTYIFDHRLFDGVMCSRIMCRLAEVLLAPETSFGPRGEWPIGRGAPRSPIEAATATAKANGARATFDRFQDDLARFRVFLTAAGRA